MLKVLGGVRSRKGGPQKGKDAISLPSDPKHSSVQEARPEEGMASAQKEASKLRKLTNCFIGRKSRFQKEKHRLAFAGKKTAFGYPLKKKTPLGTLVGNNRGERMKREKFQDKKGGW